MHTNLVPQFHIITSIIHFITANPQCAVVYVSRYLLHVSIRGYLKGFITIHEDDFNDHAGKSIALVVYKNNANVGYCKVKDLI